MEKGILAYPWDLDILGIEPSLNEIQEAGLDAICLNVGYHHGRFFRPRAKTFCELKESAISFLPDARLYGRLKPLLHVDLANNMIVEKTAKSAKERGMSFLAWLVFFHNSSLGEANESLCMQNIWKDRYIYNLCASQPDVHEYAMALMTDVCKNHKPARVVTEAVSWLPFEHNCHHEVYTTDLGETGKYLLSMCFCDECQKKASSLGVDVEKTIYTADRLMKRIIEKDIGWAEMERSSLSYYFLEFPELYDYQHARQQILHDLLTDLYAVAKKYSVSLDYVPTSMILSSVHAFWEGVSFSLLEDCVDRFSLAPYGPDASAVRHDVRSVRNVTDASLGAAISLRFGVTDSLDDLIARLEVFYQEGIEAIWFYNYGILTKERFSWIRKAIDTVGPEFWAK